MSYFGACSASRWLIDLSGGGWCAGMPSAICESNAISRYTSGTSVPFTSDDPKSCSTSAASRGASTSGDPCVGGEIVPASADTGIKATKQAVQNFKVVSPFTNECKYRSSIACKSNLSRRPTSRHSTFHVRAGYPRTRREAFLCTHLKCRHTAKRRQRHQRQFPHVCPSGLAIG